MAKSKQEQFIEKYLPSARKLEKETGIPVSLSLSQAALETGWGGGGSWYNNLFGLKSEGDAGYMYSPTWEVVDGQPKTEIGKFGAFSSTDAAFAAYGEQIKKNWPGAVGVPSEKGIAALKAGQPGGYATDPNYGQKLQNIISQYGLKGYDTVGGYDLSGVVNNIKNNTPSTVIESTFGNPSEGEGWKENAYERYEALNPPAPTVEIAGAVTDWITSPFKAAAMTIVKVILVIFVVGLAVFFLTQALKAKAINTVKEGVTGGK